jgi:hypothetical protein
MSVIERTDLREVLRETRLLHTAMVEIGNVVSAFRLAKQIRRIKIAMAKDLYNGRQYLQQTARMIHA